MKVHNITQLYDNTSNAHLVGRKQNGKKVKIDERHTICDLERN